MAMSKGEREDLLRLIKQREKVCKTAAEQRSAAMLAEFEQKISATHAFATNEIWVASVKAVQDASAEANKRIMEECGKLGIPEEFRPRIQWAWVRRGENEYEQRRAELRRVAKAEIEAIEAVARLEIEQASVAAQAEVISHGMVSKAAKAFLEKLPSIETMMPALSIETIQSKLAENARRRGDYHGPKLVD